MILEPFSDRRSSASEDSGPVPRILDGARRRSCPTASITRNACAASEAAKRWAMELEPTSLARRDLLLMADLNTGWE